MSQRLFWGMVFVFSVHLFGYGLAENRWFSWFGSSTSPSSDEKCNDDWIPRNVYDLSGRLALEVFGQHLVEKGLVRSLRSLQTYGSKKPLVYSFHGDSGVGKSFVSKLIVQSWFKSGMDSKYVHVKIGGKDYPYKGELEKYKADLTELVSKSTSECPHQIFIFDEADVFPDGLLDALVPYLSPHEKIDGVDYRNCIFILISNTGKESIRKKTFENFESDSSRTSLKHKHFEIVLTDEIQHSKNTGVTGSQLVSRHFISYYLPFLPLEREHVKQCIEKSLENKLHKEADTDVIEEVMDELIFEGPGENFSKKGCKNVDEKVNYILSPSFDDMRRYDL